MVSPYFPVWSEGSLALNWSIVHCGGFIALVMSDWTQILALNFHNNIDHGGVNALQAQGGCEG